VAVGLWPNPWATGSFWSRRSSRAKVLEGAAGLVAKLSGKWMFSGRMPLLRTISNRLWTWSSWMWVMTRPLVDCTPSDWDMVAKAPGNRTPGRALTRSRKGNRTFGRPPASIMKPVCPPTLTIFALSLPMVGTDSTGVGARPGISGVSGRTSTNAP
jgi:hypothetical protein